MSPVSRPDGSTDIVSRSREYISSVLGNLPESLKDASSEVVVEFVCDELRRIPVPLLGSILAKAVEKKYGGDKANDDSLYELGEMLESMKDSDDGLQRELENINIFLPEIMDAIAAQGQMMEERDTPDLQVLNATLDLKYPMNDNELRLILSNTGGSSVMVDEIFLDIEDWEPDTNIDFSMPAAPMQMLFLKAELSVERNEYPLFSLNSIPPRIFGERGDGAEMIIIQLSSLNNAGYNFRLRINWQDLSTGNKGVLNYPASEEKGLRLTFPYSPGWTQDIRTNSLLERKKVFQQMELKFREIRSILKDVYRSDENNTDAANKELFDIGLSAGIDTYPDLSFMISVFGPIFMELASSYPKKETEELIRDIKVMLPQESQSF
ncbi:hypothetical protein [Methanolobus sp. WCC4]|uniref:hypothetical protein n=1 Tax=Methanolobus sp. WCC4 TaxID=3125784 RepID=UPI0030F91E3A